MVEPVTITVVVVGTVMLVSTVIAAMGVVLAPTVSTPEDKYRSREYRNYKDSRERNRPSYDEMFTGV